MSTAALLAADQPSVRLRAALDAGTHPDPRDVDLLVERCRTEPDFGVRETLTWALTRLPASTTVPRLVGELEHGLAQARSQALHTLSKIGDPTAWPAITPELLRDPDDEVARSAWRAAVALVPDDQVPALARELCSQLGRGGRDVQLSLSRALAALGDPAREAVGVATRSADPEVRSHAHATERILDDPDVAFEAAMHDARRLVALGGVPSSPDADR